MELTDLKSVTDEDDAWRLHGAAAMRLATALAGPHDAHDVATEAFLRVVSQPDWTEIEHLRAYLFRAVRNEAQNHHRSRLRRWRRDLNAVTPTRRDEADVNADVRSALATLSVRARTVLFLTYWEDMTESEIADMLHLSSGTVHRDIARARAQLRRMLR